MKRHLQRGIDTIPTLSIEELAIQADEYSEAEIALAGHADALDRVTDIADVANDTMLVVSDQPQLGTIETGLIEAVADMAVAGTDADPADVLNVTPVEGALTTEGIASALKSIWDSIVVAIKNMWVGLKHWVTTYFSTLEQNKKHAEALIKKIEGMKGYLGQGDVKVIDIFNYGNYHGLNSLLISIERSEKHIRDYITMAVTGQQIAMSALGQNLEKLYSGFDGDNIDSLNAAVDNIASGMKDYTEKLGMSKGKDDNLATPAVANMVVECKGFSENRLKRENSLEGKVALLSRVRFSVNQSTEFSKETAIVYKNDIAAEVLLDKVKITLQFIDGLLDFKADQFKKLEEQVNKVQAACGKMLENIKEDNKLGQTAAKRMMPLASAYSNWAIQPAAKLLSVAARHNKFWLVLAEQTANSMKASD